MNNLRPHGKLGVLIPGLNGAVSTTFIAGTILIKKGDAKPIGSFTQMTSLKAKNNNTLVSLPISKLFPLTKVF